MRAKLTILAAGFIAAFTHCDPLLLYNVHQSLSPTPPFQCLASTLPTLPGVKKIIRLKHDPIPNRLLVVLQDSATEKTRRAMLSRDSAGFTVTFEWGGLEAIFHPSAREMNLVTGMGRRLLTQVRQTCGADEPEKIECTYGSGRAVRCGAAAA